LSLKTIVVTASIIIEEGKVLVTQRGEKSPYALFWEFPGGKVEQQEEPRQALKRELHEELGIDAEPGALFDAVYHVYPEYSVFILFYFCRVTAGVPRPLECRDLKWADGDELGRLQMLPADESIVARLKEYLKSGKDGIVE
jgi:8-oxo-dGTP diphosphatase